MFQPGLPVAGALDLVQQQILRRLSRDTQLFPSLEQSRQPDEFDEGTVKSGIPNVFGIDAVFDERVSGLPEKRGFPDLPRTAHQIVEPAANLHRDLAAGLVEKRLGGRANARRRGASHHEWRPLNGRTGVVHPKIAQTKAAAAAGRPVPKPL